MEHVGSFSGADWSVGTSLGFVFCGAVDSMRPHREVWQWALGRICRAGP